MKAIPYLRFAMAIWVSYNFINQIILEFNGNEFEFLLTILMGLMTLGFVVYCIVLGLQEIKEHRIFSARYLEYFGILFEFLVLLSGIFMWIALVQQPLILWTIIIYIIFTLGLSILLIVDLKRIRSVQV